MINLKKGENKSLKGFTFIDLFAGIGAFRKALESFGAKCVFSSEWDKDAQKIYELNYGEKPKGDITAINEKNIPDHNILCAGFPCQPFSISGKQLGFADTRGTLFFDVARIVKEKRPEIILLENVKNFASHDNGNTLAVVKKTLEDLGYSVNYKILDASKYGVPQARYRIFFVCFRNELGTEKFNFPEPVVLKKHLCDFLLSDSQTEDFIINRTDITMKQNVKEEYCGKPLRLGIVNKGGQGERIYSVKGTAITLSAFGGGVGAKTGLYLVNGKIRRLAPRECARLDGFPDSFIISDNKNVAYKQFGNSIVIDVIQYIIREILSTAQFTNIRKYNTERVTVYDRKNG